MVLFILDCATAIAFHQWIPAPQMRELFTSEGYAWHRMSWKTDGQHTLPPPNTHTQEKEKPDKVEEVTTRHLSFCIPSSSSNALTSLQLKPTCTNQPWSLPTRRSYFMIACMEWSSLHATANNTLTCCWIHAGWRGWTGHIGPWASVVWLPMIMQYITTVQCMQPSAPFPPTSHTHNIGTLLQV